MQRDEAWANRNTGEEREYDERLEWLAHDFDPETFSLDKVNEECRSHSAWIGQEPGSSAQAAGFAVGDRVRTKPGVMHGQYPDIPLGGWVGTITKIAWLVPLSYEVRWTDETLAAAHPVYGKRCRRDDDAPETYWLDEGDLDADCPDGPVEMEQPANLIVKPLSAEDQDDRIRMVFGLTSDDRRPNDGRRDGAAVLGLPEGPFDLSVQRHVLVCRRPKPRPRNKAWWSGSLPRRPSMGPADRCVKSVGKTKPEPVLLDSSGVRRRRSELPLRGRLQVLAGGRPGYWPLYRGG